MIDIVKGHIKELVKSGEELYKERIQICYKCPLYSKKFGGLCNNKLWLDLETGDVIDYYVKGYKRGCGCRLQAKTRLEDSKCPIGKW